MITSILIENFKCFSELRLPLGPLTLFTGYNGGGKSSAIQPLLLLAQGLRRTMRPREYALNGALVRLGTTTDLIHSSDNMTSPRILFTVATAMSDTKWTLLPRADGRSLCPLEPDDVPDPLLLSSAAEHLRTLSYISAIRQGTADTYPVPDIPDEFVTDVGIDGRFASYWYDRDLDDEVEEQRRHPAEPASSVRKQLDAWLAALFPGARANVRKLPPVPQLCLQFQLSDIGEWRRPANVGFGLSYAFPILVALLTAHEGQIVVIDSPEAHLHPFAQSQMGQLLAKFAAAGVQVLIETHSDHLLNGVRLAIKDGTLLPETAQIHFFTGATTHRHGVISPTVDVNGGMSEWPGGFFDQSEKDLSRLSGWT